MRRNLHSRWIAIPACRIAAPLNLHRRKRDVPVAWRPNSESSRLSAKHAKGHEKVLSKIRGAEDKKVISSEYSYNVLTL